MIFPGCSHKPKTKRNFSNWTSFYTNAFQPFCCSGTCRKSLHCSWNPMPLSKCLYFFNHIELWLRILSQALSVCFDGTPGSHSRNPEVPRNLGWKILFYTSVSQSGRKSDFDGEGGEKNKRGDMGAKKHQGGENAQLLIDHWVNFSIQLLWLVRFLQILIYNIVEGCC